MTDQIHARITAAIRDTPARYPDDIATAVKRAIQPELDSLAALRQVARGYCPECGRGDAAPTVADWEQQKQRANRAEAKIADYENRITWETNCGSCARILDSSIRETERADRAIALLHEIPYAPHITGNRITQWRGILDNLTDKEN